MGVVADPAGKSRSERTRRFCGCSILRSREVPTGSVKPLTAGLALRTRPWGSRKRSGLIEVVEVATNLWSKVLPAACNGPSRAGQAATGYALRSLPRASFCACTRSARPAKDLHLSTAGTHAAGFHPRVKIRSARWVRIQSAPTLLGEEP